MLDYKLIVKLKQLDDFYAQEECTVARLAINLKATSHSTIFDIPMRPLREDQRHRRRFTR